MYINVQKYSMTIGISFYSFRKCERSNRQKSFRGKFLCELWNRVRINRSSPSIHLYRVNINGMKKKYFYVLQALPSTVYRNNGGNRNGFFFFVKFVVWKATFLPRITQYLYDVIQYQWRNRPIIRRWSFWFYCSNCIVFLNDILCCVLNIIYY